MPPLLLRWGTTWDYRPPCVVSAPFAHPFRASWPPLRGGKCSCKSSENLMTQGFLDSVHQLHVFECAVYYSTYTTLTLEDTYLISKSRATASPNLGTPARRRANGGQPGTKAHRRARKNRAQIAGLGHTRPAVPLRAKRGGPGGTVTRKIQKNSNLVVSS